MSDCLRYEIFLEYLHYYGQRDLLLTIIDGFLCCSILPLVQSGFLIFLSMEILMLDIHNSCTYPFFSLILIDGNQTLSAVNSQCQLINQINDKKLIFNTSDGY